MRPERYYKQQLTYWGIASRDQFGSVTYLSPVPFLGRWEDKVIDVMSARGEQFQSRSIIYIPSTLAIEVDGWLYNGVSISVEPTQLKGAYRIKDIQQTPDLRALIQVTTAIL